MAYDPRVWKFVKDVNHDGYITISDVFKWIVWLFFYPGDLCIKLLIKKAPGVARFLELSYRDYGSTFSAIISAVSWIIIVIIVLVLFSSIIGLLKKIKNKFLPKE